MIAAIAYAALVIAVACWLAYEMHTAPFEPADWSLPALPGVVALRGDAQDGGE